MVVKASYINRKIVLSKKEKSEFQLKIIKKYVLNCEIYF